MAMHPDNLNSRKYFERGQVHYEDEGEGQRTLCLHAMSAWPS